MESILTTIKKKLGIIEEYEYFDADIIADINSVFMILNQLGVGPEEPFSIQDKTAVWDDFSEDIANIEAIKSYIFMKVRLMFDTSTLTSAVIDSYNKLIAEFEWRLNVQADKT